MFKTFIKIAAIVVTGYYIWIFAILPVLTGAAKAIFYRPPKATPVYGLLDPLEFVEKSTTKSTPKYSLNTKNGKLPNNFPTVMPVYKFKAKPFSYLASDNAIKDAEYLGFTEENLITDLKGTIFRWRNPVSGTILEIDKDSRRLDQTTNLTGKSQDFVAGVINEENAKEKAIDLFKALSRFNDTLYPKGFQTVIFGGYSGSRMVETTASRDAVVAKVDLFRKVGDYVILGPDPKKALLSVVLRANTPSNSQKVLNYPIIDANYTEIESTTQATYPIISVNQAWKAVQNGQGIVTNVTPSDTNPFEDSQQASLEDVLIDNVYLAYYESIKTEKFLQPIYVFEGKYTSGSSAGGSISIYFPAVTGEYVKKTQ